jgi:asparagine synthase (glutamine-hydrolysing)
LIQEVDRISEEVADAIGADMHFNGGGGDNVFCYLGSAAPLADRLLREGPGRGAMATARAIGAITGASLWTVPRLAARKLPSHARAYRWHMDETLMPKGIATEIGLPGHPWLDAPRDALPGQAAHIAALLRIENHVEGLGRGQRRGICAPLLSQPLVETCLAIPSWYWCEGGVNRAIARKAFAGRLPAPILDRQIKGTPDSFSANLFEANRALLAEILLGGRLAAQGLIDRQAVADVLRWEGPVRGLAHLRILTFATVEAWIAAWKAAPRRCHDHGFASARIHAVREDGDAAPAVPQSPQGGVQMP